MMLLMMMMMMRRIRSEEGRQFDIIDDAADVDCLCVQVTRWLCNTLGLTTSAVPPADHTSLLDIPAAEFELPPEFLKCDLPESLRGTLPEAPRDHPQPQQAAAPAPAPASTSAVPGAAAAAAAAPPQEPLLPGTPTAQDDDEKRERRQRCFYVLKTPGLTADLYQDSVNLLDFYDAVDMTREAEKLADGVKELLEERIRNGLMGPRTAAA